MKEMDEMLKELFRNEPIAQEPLQKMNATIMEQILACPMDFEEKRSLAQRRKWGKIFLTTVLTLSLSFFLLNWFFGPWLRTGLYNGIAWLAGQIPTLAWILGRWDWLFDKWEVLANLKIGFQFLWGQYGLAIMGILFAWVLFEGIKGNIVVKAMERNS